MFTGEVCPESECLKKTKYVIILASDAVPVFVSSSFLYFLSTLHLSVTHDPIRSKENLRINVFIYLFQLAAQAGCEEILNY